ncbi:opioid-binding protein/cell adhesion molecule homolog [Alosa pseudoharengus]|uniref:opioid-binding protein/cell adhesion molecule homolog n=1 Tax=Alosa pseudoharengus TaxID=34774 RepID=UPI003F89B354
MMEGNNVKLICNNICSSLYKPTVIWRKNGQVVTGKQTKNNTLILRSVSVDDDGYYSCVLKDGHPSKPVRLHVIFPPKNTSVSISPAGEILEGASVTLTCSSDANPPVARYTWYKKTGTTSSVLAFEQTYTISNISSEHTGDYYCEGRNTHGACNSTHVFLDGHYAPRNISTSLIHPGDDKDSSSVSLTCSSDANPPVENYSWYRRTAAETVRVGTGERINFEVAWSGFGWQKAALFSSVGLLTALILLIALVLWRKKKAKPNNNSRRSDVTSQHAPQCIPDNVYEDVSDLLLASAPAQRVDSQDDQDDVQYASVQIKRSRGQQVALYSTVQKPKPHTQQLEEDVYAPVNFCRLTAATQ